jgi:hypothetical protein
MRFAVATFHVPHPEGSAAGRQLAALAGALTADGHEVEAWCWGPNREGLTVPEWCRWDPVAVPTGWQVKARTLLRPRRASGSGGWRPPEGTVGWADDWASWPAVDRDGAPALLTVHYDVALDARALRWSLPLVQDWRAQRRAVRRSPCTVALSARVASAAGVGTVVPATVPMPEQPLPVAEEPRALMFADWSWPANVRALRRLLDGWSQVRARVPGATLVVAGRGAPEVSPTTGVQVIGAVERTVDAMADAAVLAFPCPPTSGPKMKVLDACAAGLPVVTTASGVEGLDVPDDAVAVSADADYLEVLADVLADVTRRTTMATTARAAVLAHHAPDVAARARVDALLSRAR